MAHADAPGSVSWAFVRDPFVATRRETREVRVGDVGIGGANPIRVQSMTTTDTRDTKATVDQTERLVEAGCEIVRVTAPSITDAENLREIKAEMRRRGIRVPLVADIHFTPNAALIAADIVEKVRINPGNYADKKRFDVREYSDEQYAAELERVAERFRPLVRRMKQNGAALRIGTNHGSLSDRIMNRYGDTPRGMVESALEFLTVCEEEGYRDVVFSMKASNAQVAVQAYRMLAARLAEREPGVPSYPFHVGVTEAGDAEDGRIKSAIGIGALLEDGIGDTIRVSLTEDPVKEIPVACALARRAHACWTAARDEIPKPHPRLGIDPYVHRRRETRRLGPAGAGIGGDEPVRVEVELESLGPEPHELAARLATSLARIGEVRCEGLRVRAASRADRVALRDLAGALPELGVETPLVVELPNTVGASELRALLDGLPPEAATPRFAIALADLESRASSEVLELLASRSAPIELCAVGDAAALPGQVERALSAASRIAEASRAEVTPPFLLSVLSPGATHAGRLVAALLEERGAGSLPMLLRCASGQTREAALLDAAVDFGAPLCDGIGDAISLHSAPFGDVGAAVDVAYRILQGARLRTTRTEYISCPSCGRTLFDLEETTARIKAKTDHLQGVKIAVMGCIVNGPGEMADADFGYVGSGVGKVTLYVGQNVTARNIPEAEAADRLVELIRSEGMWRDPV